MRALDLVVGGPAHSLSGMEKLFLAGDVMIGRGIDQILRHPVHPAINEPHVKSAQDYVTLAERASGPIPRGVDDRYVWGDVIAELDRSAPGVRIINLETAVTARGTPWPSKEVSYRTHNANIGVLRAAAIDVCSLANNHVLDWSYQGLEDTLDALDRGAISVVGAGRDRSSAEAPAVVPVNGSRIVVFGIGSPTSGIPAVWEATSDRAGIAFMPELSAQAADAVGTRVARYRRPGDLVVVSIHWGSNWGHQVPKTQTRFAHRLIDAGVDIVHGHSSHHAKAIEVYHNRLILYGCGDLINDYEGIGGYEEYHSHLGLMYLVTMGSHQLQALEMTPIQMRRFRAERVTGPDVEWLAKTLDRHSQAFGTRIRVTDDERLEVVW